MKRAARNVGWAALLAPALAYAQPSATPAASPASPSQNASATGSASTTALRFVGNVLDATTRQPVAGAVITITRRAIAVELVASDDDGSFTFVAPPGSYQLEITAPWLTTRRLDVVLRDRDVTMELLVTDDANKIGTEEILVQGVAATGVGRTTVTAKLGRNVPGGGDTLKVVQALPAVARPPAGSSNLIVWGAAPRDTRVFVDGVPVPALYHLGGYRAAVGNEAIEAVALSPAAFAADRGGAIGGIIDVIQQSAVDGPRLVVTADVLDLGGIVRTRQGRNAFAVGGRSSVLAPVVGAVVDTDRLGANAPLPTWADAQASWARPWRSSELRMWTIAARDRLKRTLPAADPAVQTTDDVASDMVRWAATLRHQGSATSSELTLWLGATEQSTSLQVGELSATRSNRAYALGARAAERSALSSHFDLTLGLDLEAEWAQLARRGSLSIPAREGDPRIFGQPPGDDVNTDNWRANTANAGAYAALTVAAARTLAVLGLRTETWLLTASRLTPRVGATPAIAAQDITVTVSPRGSVKIDLGKVAARLVQLRIDAGRYLQARAPEDTSAVFGSPNLGREQAWHATVGVQWQYRRVIAEAAAYARWLNDLVVRDTSATPKLAAVLTQLGTGRVLGLQLTARLVPWHGVEGWISYGISRSTRRDAADAVTRLFDNDQTHNLVAVVGWRRGRWRVGGRVRVATGEPRTSVVGAFFDGRSGRYQPIRGSQNDVRLPLFFALDARVQRSFAIGNGTLAAYVELQNLSNRANAEEFVYSADYQQQRFLSGLPLLTIAGLRWELP